jgi:poly-gamma-glutamate synthesis protein (capsule biosynthesis protein)
MLGREVGAHLARVGPRALVAEEVVAITRDADLFVLNLECAISDRGRRWPDPNKPFFFRAPPSAIEVLVHLGVGCVTLANNHALDYDAEALVDTLDRLDGAGITAVGAGRDERAARRAAVVDVAGRGVGIVGVTDHPRAFAAAVDRPGVAYANLRHTPPRWLHDTIASLDTDVVLVTPHWGPNMTRAPRPHVRAAAAAFRSAGATLVAGHSAHVFHGVADHVLYDLGDFIDDYARDPVLRNDLGLLFVVTFDLDGLTRVDAVPLALDHCHTRLAKPHEAAWIAARYRRACAALGTEVDEREGRLVVEWEATPVHCEAEPRPADRGISPP